MTTIQRDKHGVPTIASIRDHLAHREAIGRAGRNREDGFCVFHERSELSYMAWHSDATKRMKAGEKQTQCTDCGKWLWSHELGNPLNTHLKED